MRGLAAAMLMAALGMGGTARAGAEVDMVLTPLASPPGDAEAEALAAGVRVELAERLARVRGLALPFPTAVGWAAPATASGTARAVRLAGRIESTGDGPRLTLEAHESDKPLWTGTFRVAEVGAAAAAVAHALGLSAPRAISTLAGPAERPSFGRAVRALDAALLGGEQPALEEAQALARALTIAHADDPWGWTLLGVASLALHDLASAEPALARAGVLGPELWWARLVRADAASDVDALRALLRLNPRLGAFVAAYGEALASSAAKHLRAHQRRRAQGDWDELERLAVEPPLRLSRALRLAEEALTCDDHTFAARALDVARRAWERLDAVVDDDSAMLFELERRWRGAAQDTAGSDRAAGKDDRDCTGATPLIAAAERGDGDEVRRRLVLRDELRATNHRGETALHRAARAGQLAVVALLAREPALVDAVDDFGRTPLTSAIRAGRSDVAAALLAAGARVGARTRDRRTPLHEAARLGEGQLAARLIAAGAPLEARDERRATPLALAAEAAQRGVAAALLRAGARIDGGGGADPPLVIVAGSARAKERATTIAWLVAAGANPKARSASGETALHAAARGDHADAVAALLAAGADIDALNEAGLSALRIAVRYQKLAALEHLIDHLQAIGRAPKLRQLMREAVEAEAEISLRWLLAHERAAAHDNTGDAGLLRAVIDADKPTLVAAFLDAGESLSGAPGETLLHVAARADAPGVVRLLAKRGVPLEAHDASGKRALHSAIEAGAIRAMRALLDAGARSDALYRGLRPVDWALVQPAPTMAILEALAEPGDAAVWAWLGDLDRLGRALADDPAAAKRLGRDGLGAIHHAARAGADEALALLLARGAPAALRAKADIAYAPEVARWTPMHFAFALGSLAIIERLEKAGASIEARDAKGRPAWAFAFIRGYAPSELVERWPRLEERWSQSLPSDAEILLDLFAGQGYGNTVGDVAQQHPLLLAEPRPAFAPPSWDAAGLAGGLGVQLRPDPPELAVLERWLVDGGGDDGTAAEGLEDDLARCYSAASWPLAMGVAADLLAERRDPDQGDARLVALALQNRAAVALRLGDVDAARSDFDAALAAIGPALAAVRAAILENRSEVPWRTGAYEEAEANLQAAIALRGSLREPMLPRPAILLGMVYTDWGRYRLAIEALRQGVALADNDLADYAWYARNNLGVLLDGLGDRAAARALAEEQLARSQSWAGSRPIEMAVAEHNMARFALRDRALERARDLARGAIARVRRAAPEHWVLGRLLLGSGHAARALGMLDEAEQAYREGEAVLAAAHGQAHGFVAEALRHLGLVRLAKGDAAGGREALARAWVIASQAEAPEVRWPIELALGKVEAAAGRLAAAIFFGKQAVTTLQALRRDAAGSGRALEASFVEERVDAWHTLAGWLAEAGRLGEAAQVIDLLKGEELDSLVVRGRGEGAAGSAAAVRDVALGAHEAKARAGLERQLASITELGVEYAALKRRPSLDEAGRQRLAALRELVAEANRAFGAYLGGLEDDTRSMTPERAADIAAMNVRDAAARQRTLRDLGHGAVLLHYLIAPERLHILVTTPTVQIGRSVAVTARELTALIFAFRRVLGDPRSDARPLARELHRYLIAPIEDDLRGARAETLMVALDGALRYMPMAALNDGQRWLVERYRLALYSSAAADKLTATPARGTRMAALGLSKKKGLFSELAAVPMELEGIVRQGGADRDGVVPGRVWLDEAFTRDALVEVLESGQYGALHLASHFVFEPGSELDSYLVLPKGSYTLEDVRTGPPFDGIDLLTLSACNTALGDVADADGPRQGREVEGFAMLTLLRGARGVVATLWPVADSSTGTLMRSLYALREEDAKLTRADALRLAQLRFIRGRDDLAAEDLAPRGPRPLVAPPGGSAPEPPAPDAPTGSWSHPYYWAPFVLIGNWL